MPEVISLGSDSSSDDDFYDNFDKIKLKAAHCQKKRRHPITASTNKFTRKNAPSDSIISCEEIVCVEDFDSSANFCANNSSIPAVIELNSPSCSNSIEVIDLTPFGSSLTNNYSNKNYKAQKSKNIIPSPKSTCTITIHSNGGKRMFIQDLDDPIKNLIEDYAERVNGDPKRIVLITKQLKQCALEDTPRTLGITSDESFELDAFEHKDVVPLNLMEDVKTIRIKYQQKGKRPIVSKILKTAKFARLKEIFCQENGLLLDKVQFIFDSVRVGDNETAETLDLEDDDCIDVYVLE
ncbi:unnamed protein product [Meloidogyne enterolobii]|uniref:Uncharacterized protein n=1 Tax=Meloidogyne enterolobii TaxID=390850 RepID=A0ACB0ZI54_MELEN